MRPIPHITLFFATTLFLIAAAYGQKAAFMPTSEGISYAVYRKGEILYHHKGHQTPVVIPNSSDPSLSADGKLLAYTKEYPSVRPNAAAGNRTIAVYNVASRRTKTLSFKSEQVCCPVWNPVGNLFACNFFGGGSWNVAIVDTSGRVSLIERPILRSLYGISWTSDGSAIAAHSMDTLYVIDTSGTIKRRLRISEITLNKSISSATVFTFTEDGESLLFLAENPEANRSNLKSFASPSALYKYHLASRKLTKLTPNHLACNGYQVAGDSIYFSAAVISAKPQFDIYKMSLNGTNLAVFINDGRDITVPAKKGL